MSHLSKTHAMVEIAYSFPSGITQPGMKGAMAEHKRKTCKHCVGGEPVLFLLLAMEHTTVQCHARSITLSVDSFVSGCLSIQAKQHHLEHTRLAWDKLGQWSNFTAKLS